MKMTVLYHSQTGTTKQAGENIVQGMISVESVEAKIFSIHEIEEEWTKESKCVVLGTPIYMASVSGILKSWLETAGRKYELSGKLGGAFATADYLHGGGELGIQTILDHMLTFGMLTYSGGGAYGKPVIHLGPVGLKGHLSESEEIFKLYGKRMATKTIEIFG